MDSSEGSEARIAGRNFAWQSFDIHAKQRVEIFKAYLTLIAVIFAGYGISLQSKFFLIGVLLSIYSLLISIIFFFLDVRTRALIKGAEAFLIGEESRLAVELGDDSIRLFTNSDKTADESKWWVFKNSYSFLLKSFFITNMAISLILGTIFTIFCIRV